MKKQSIGSGATIFGRAVLLGVVAGSRSLLPLAMESRAARRGQGAREARFPTLAHPVFAIGLPLAAAGEIVADKLPVVPSRLAAGPLAGRVVLGMVACAAFAGDEGGSPIAGAVAGAIGTALGSLAGNRSRAWLGRVTGWPDLVWALVEDALALHLGRTIIGMGRE